MEMPPFYQGVDPYLIWFYRLTGQPWVDFVIGTFILAGISLVIGEITVFWAVGLTRKRLDRHTEEAAKYQTLAIDALKAGDKEAYTAANKLANEAFGHTFFQQAALSAAFLWPVFFALAWMQYRFLEVEFPIPGTGWSFGFIGVFIIIYVFTYFLFKGIKSRLRFCRRLGAVLAPDAPHRLGNQGLPGLTSPLDDSDKK